MSLQLVEWTDEIAAKLSRAMGAEPERKAIRAEVEKGLAQVWCVGNHSYMITRFEATELVVIAYEGEQVQQTTRHVIKLAKLNGLLSIRFHTQRPALIRLLKPFNPEPVEYVARIYLDGK